MTMKTVIVYLPDEQVEFLQRTAAKEHLTVTDVLRRAISTEKFFIAQEDTTTARLMKVSRKR